ncbi:hypothetical protein OUY24_44070, partial [Nonomuraea ferruginea]|nr:hypothetical protein [Nonomuraea ferruginea]
MPQEPPPQTGESSWGGPPARRPEAAYEQTGAMAAQPYNDPPTRANPRSAPPAQPGVPGAPGQQPSHQPGPQPSHQPGQPGQQPGAPGQPGRRRAAGSRRRAPEQETRARSN